MWTSLLAVMVKELRQAFRDKRTAMLLLVAPILQVGLLGYAVDFDVDQIPTVVCDQDRSQASRELVAGLTAGTTFRVVGELRSAEEASAWLEDGRAAVVVVLPRGLGRDLAHGRPVGVQVVMDGSEPNRGQIASAAASQYFAGRGLELARERLRTVQAGLGRDTSMPQLKLAPRFLYNPTQKSAIFMVPGVMAMVLLVVTTIVTAMGLARERELGTIEQLMVTPIHPIVLMAGKCLPFALIGLADAAVLLAVGHLLFDVPLRGHLGVVMLGAGVYLLTTLGTGIFVSTIGRTQQQVVLGAFFFIMPAILLSGFASPIENMPDWIVPITYLNPVRYFVEIMRSVLLRGAGLSELAPQFLALLAFGLAILGVSALRFRKTLS
ncbi:MAG TPA: ABC transporter permease [Myxococcota bacterium]|nr:ABC transporter permease [Myxococcota bacterium]HRY93997.1 ABC transporter permease [Myxococcota bacterium]HSA24628.1 ABC transporter permease [Myxococcota bacterium]